MNKLSRATNPLLHFDDFMGVPLAGGKLCTFAGGKPVCTYKDADGTLNSEEIRLNSRGEADVWLNPAVTYKFVLKNAVGKVVYVIDNVTANTKTFQAVGSDTVEATEETVDGKTVVTFKVKAGSIGKAELKNPRDLIPDTQYIKMERQEGSEEVIISLAAEVPSNDGTYVLKIINGTMQWVAE